MGFRRREEPSVEAERETLREQRAAVEEMKRQLAERVAAVRERESELQEAIAAAGGQQGHAAAASPETLRPDALHTHEQHLAERERELVAHETDIARRERELRDGLVRLEAREQELMEQSRQTPPPTAAASRVEGDADRLAQIEGRLAELRKAEAVFLRTRDELAARSEAVAARERLAALKERELDEREDGAIPRGGIAISEVEARLRRLEQQAHPEEPPPGFSGGLRKLQQGSRRPRPN